MNRLIPILAVCLGAICGILWLKYSTDRYNALEKDYSEREGMELLLIAIIIGILISYIF